jgi:hypothetical protein
MIGALAVVGWGLLAEPAAALLTDAEKCEAAKLKVAGKYFFCVEKAHAKAVRTGDALDTSKCMGTFGGKWEQAETEGGGMCPDGVSVSAMHAHLAQQAAQTAAIIAGTQGICGDGAIHVGTEQCDDINLGGETCVSLLGPGTSGTLACAADCTFDTAACLPCTGAVVGGSCWHLGPTFTSCDDTCAAVGRTCDPATATYAGSSGTLAGCAAVLAAIAPAYPAPVDSPCGVGMGCTSGVSLGSPFPESYRCINPPTTCNAVPPTIPGVIFRACACQ